MKSITLNIGNEDRVFYFGLGFLGNLLEKENIDMSDIDSELTKNPFKWIPLIMFHSCSYGYIRKGEFIPFDKFSVSEWIDELGMDSDIVKSFFPAFNQSLVKNVPEDKSKKKVTKK